jgi:branched-chain amino acid transport system substrate-binding protein
MILKQAKDLGVSKEIKFIGSEEMGEMELLSLAGQEATEGTYAVSLWGGVPPEFAQKVKDKYNAPMHYAIIFGYDALYVVVDAIKRAGSLDSTKIKDALKATDYQGLEGHIKFQNFDGFTNQGKAAPFLIEWQAGERKPLQ